MPIAARRARLLDLGDTGAVRSQSVYHAVTANLRPADDPALVVLRPATAGVIVGSFKGAMPDLDFCRERRLPVVWRHDGGETAVVDSDQLCFQLVLPRGLSGELGLPREPVGRLRRIAQAPIEAYRRLGIDAVFRPVNIVEVGGRAISSVGTTEIGVGIALRGSLVFDFDPEVLAGVLRADVAQIESSTTSIRRELASPPPLAAIAEALVAAFESLFGLELFPSLPTPEEMEAIWEWDETLLSNGGPHRQRLSA